MPPGGRQLVVERSWLQISGLSFTLLLHLYFEQLFTDRGLVSRFSFQFTNDTSPRCGIFVFHFHGFDDQQLLSFYDFVTVSVTAMLITLPTIGERIVAPLVLSAVFLNALPGTKGSASVSEAIDERTASTINL